MVGSIARLAHGQVRLRYRSTIVCSAGVNARSVASQRTWVAVVGCDVRRAPRVLHRLRPKLDGPCKIIQYNSPRYEAIFEPGYGPQVALISNDEDLPYSTSVVRYAIVLPAEVADQEVSC
jgi:hypothetical protein